MRKFALAPAVLLIVAMHQLLTTPSASAAGCSQQVSLDLASAECTSPEGVSGNLGAVSSDQDIRLLPVCLVRNLSCLRSATCTSTNGEPGQLTDLWINGVYQGAICIGEAEADAAGIVTPAQVLRAMRRLDWPESQLVIQPPDGLTLVNFATNFYTPSARPITRSVTLLGQRITIEATPAEYHWHFGDGRSLSTTEPGAPYPDLTVTHDYLRKGTYGPRLDTVYRGRYRVAGGPWQTIPGSVTVDGTLQRLRVIEAQPKLVGY